MLVEGAFPPNSRLTEAALAERLGVSRTPVRDALSTLATEGLLSHEPNRGYGVLTCTLEDVLGAYEVRGTLEALACRKAAERGVEVVERARMMDAVERIDSLLTSGAWRGDEARLWRELNSAFHGAIANAAGNRTLARTVRESQRLPILVAGGGARWFAHSELVLFFDDAAVRRSQADHKAILSCLVKGDGPAAATRMQAHIERAMRVLRAHWQEAAASRKTLQRSRVDAA